MTENMQKYVVDNMQKQISELKNDICNDTKWTKNIDGCNSVIVTEIKEENK
jgi:hypothetical protein